MAWAGNRAYQAGGLNTADLRRARWGRGGGDGGRGGGDDMASQMAMALNLLGLGPQQQQQREELGLRREDIESQRTAREAASDVAAKTLAETTRGNLATEAFQQWTRQQAADALTRETEFKTAQLKNEAMKNRLDVLKTYVSDTSIPVAERQKAWATLDPDIQQMLTKQAEAANRAEALKQAPNIRAVYGKPEQLKNLLSGIPQEVLQRPELPWGQWNQELAAEQAKSPSQGAGVVGALWNTPMATQNLIRSGLNVGGKVLLGEQAPEFAYGKYTKPSLEGIDTSKIPAMISQALQLGVPGVGAVGQADVMTQPAPWAGEPPADEYAPGASFSRQGLPTPHEPSVVDRLLATLGLK